MDQLKSVESLSSELTVEALIWGVLALEQSEAKKTFKLLEKGLELLVAQNFIPSDVAKQFRQLRAKILEKKETSMKEIVSKSMLTNLYETRQEGFAQLLREEIDANLSSRKGIGVTKDEKIWIRINKFMGPNGLDEEHLQRVLDEYTIRGEWNVSIENLPDGSWITPRYIVLT